MGPATVNANANAKWKPRQLSPRKRWVAEWQRPRNTDVRRRSVSKSTLIAGLSVVVPGPRLFRYCCSTWTQRALE